MSINIETHVKLDKVVIRGDELLFDSLFPGATTTLNATVIIFLFLLPLFSEPHLMRGLLHYIVSIFTISIVHLLII